MEVLFMGYLFILGLLFGSFGSVVIQRLKFKKSGIVGGRSECPKCKHLLGAKDLIPVFSFLSTGGKCRYCKERISPLYPILELSMAVMFCLSGYFFIDIPSILLLNSLEIYKLFFFLVLAFGTVIYVVYDILYLEIPEKVLLGLIACTFLTLALQSFSPSFQVLSFAQSQIFLPHQIWIILGYGIFVLASLYFIMLQGLKEIYDIFIILALIGIGVYIKFFLYIDLEQSSIGSGILGALGLFIFLFIQILISGGNWMGGGDLRIAILMGLIAGVSYSFPSVMIAYFTGSVVGIFLIVYTKTREHYIAQKHILKKIKTVLGLKNNSLNLDTKMPFGPFLALGIYGVLFFYHEISWFLEHYL